MSTDHTSTTPDLLGSSTTRRQLLALAAVGGAGLATVRAASPATAAPGQGTNGKVVRLTVLGTTDLHGNVYNWDYFKNAEYDDKAHNDIGVAKAVVHHQGDPRRGRRRAHPDDRRRRHDPGHAARVLLRQDRPDHRRREAPDGRRHERRSATTPRPSATTSSTTASTRCGPSRSSATSRCSSPTPSTGTPAPRSSRRASSRRSRCAGSKPIKVGILGLVTPGVAIWDKANVEGKVKFPGIVEQAKVLVPRLKAAGADVVIVVVPLRRQRQVLVLRRRAALPRERERAPRRAGPRHRRRARRPRPPRDPAALRHEPADRQAGAARPSRYYWGMRVTRMSLDLQKVRGQWQVVALRGDPLQLQRRTRGPRRRSRRRPPPTRRSSPTSTASSARARGHVGGDVALRGHRRDRLHQLRPGRRGQEGPRRHARGVPPGAVDRRAVQQARRDPGRRRDGPRRGRPLHLRQHPARASCSPAPRSRPTSSSRAEYFKQVRAPADAADASPTPTPSPAPNGTPDYNYDIMGGLDAAAHLRHRPRQGRRLAAS